MPVSALKMHFFDKNGNLTPRLVRTSANVKELFFWEVILHQFLKQKNWAMLGKNVQAILTLFNLARKVPFLEDLKKKVSKSDWNHIHKVYVTQIHHNTWFLTPFLLKNAQTYVKKGIFICFKNPHFCLFSWVLEVKLIFKDKFYDIID